MTERSNRRIKSNSAGPPPGGIVASGGEAALEAVATPRRIPIAPRRARRVTEPPPPIAELPVEPAFEDAVGVATETPVRTVRTGISAEALVYVLILIAAVLTRFWNLGAKALHHDESLHAYYSWVLETGGGYRHDPLMHGPFLFHANALVYLLFGDSDATSRYMPALFGVAAVGLPYLLRSPNLLGRWGALTTSLLILISPVILYQSRYIRHDIYTVTGTLLLFIAIVRYWEVPQRRWLIIGAGSIAFLLTNHEIVFAIVAIFFGYLYVALLLSRIRAWWADRPRTVLLLAGAHVGLLAAILALIALVPKTSRAEIFDIPWENPTSQQQFDYYQKLLGNPLVLGALAILAVFLIAMWFILASAQDPDRRSEGRLVALFGDPKPRTVEAGIRNAWADRHGLAIGLVVGFAIFATLFTSFYTNLYGLISSTVATDGTLLYWLGQHDYQRGEQPWFYFLVLMPQYEFIAFLFGGIMLAVVAVRAIRALIGRGEDNRLFVHLMIATWFVGIFIGLSYAGEKMPWLLSHIALPAILLAGALIGGIIERVLSRRAIAVAENDSAAQSKLHVGWPEWALGGALLLAAAAWFGLASELSIGRFVESAQPGGWTRTVTSSAADRWWWLTIPVILALVLVTGATLLRGSRRTALMVVSAATIVLALLQMNVGWRLSYQDPDVPTEMMIYTQTSPDIVRVMDEITELSYELTGGKNIEIWYDGGVSWPMQWYLRDFPNKQFRPSITTDPGNAPIVMVASDRDSQAAPNLAGYTGQEYVLRWWFPEDLYRDFAIAPEISPGRSAWKRSEDPHGIGDVISSAIDSINGTLTVDGQARLYRQLVYRDIEQPLGQYRFKIYVRNDLIPLLNSIRY